MKKISWLKRDLQRFKTTYFLVFFTLVLGLSGIFIIEQLKSALLFSLKSQEKELLSSDIAMSARRPLSELEVERFNKKFSPIASYRILDMSSMLYNPKKDESRLVELRVIEPGFPFYGSLDNSKGAIDLSPLSDFFKTEDCLLVHVDTMRSLELTLGQYLRLGEKNFRFCDVVEKDSSLGFRAFALAPRIYLSRKNLEGTGLYGEGSIASHSIHLKTQKSIEELELLQKELKEEFSDPTLRINLPSDTSEQVARAGNVFSDYLQLISLVSFILSVVGTFYLFRGLIGQRLKDAAILRALGLSPISVQFVLIIGLIFTFLLSIPAAYIASLIITPTLLTGIKSVFGLELSLIKVSWRIWSSLPLVSLFLFASMMPVIRESVRIPVIVLIQNQTPKHKGRWLEDWSWNLISFLSLWSLAIWASQSWKVGSLFIFSIVLSLGIFTLIFSLAKNLINKLLLTQASLQFPLGLEWGIVLRRLIRQPLTTLISIISLGLGALLLSLLFHIEKSVNQEFTIGADSKPSLFLFDIQDEQVERLKKFFNEQSIEIQALSPMIRGKLMKVNDSQYKADDEATTGFKTREEENDSRFRQRMMNLSWSEGLNTSETLVAGELFSDYMKLEADETAISVEKRFASRLDLKLSDRLEFDVLGVPVVGRVVNIRSVKWTSFRPNFFITFAPGALEEAPKSWLAAIGSLPQEERVRVQNKIQKIFSNISVVDITQLVERLSALFSRLKIALEMMAYFTILVGFVVVLSMTYHQLQKRESEMMLEKTLGISPYRVIKMLAYELLFVGIIAFGAGGVCGALLANSISVFLLEGNAVWDVAQLVYLILFGLVLVMLPVVLLVPKILNTRPAGLLQRP